MKFVLLLFLFSQVSPSPQPPDHSFVKKVVSSKASVTDDTTSVIKKVFIKFVRDPSHSRKGEKKEIVLLFPAMVVKSIRTIFL